MACTLTQLLAPLGLAPSRSCDVLQITADSRAVQPGGLFLAYPGHRSDGRDFIQQAIDRGAVAVLFEAQDADVLPVRGVISVAIPDLRRHVSQLASVFYGHPSRKLTMIGITGTNGKTSTAIYIAKALNQLGCRCGVIGTLGHGFMDALMAGSLTTPDAIDVQAELARFLDLGAEAIVMEVSSHALDQFRVAGVAFDYAVFTNLTRDHLDYHGTMEAYFIAKAKLFAFESLQAVVINHDDHYGQRLIQQLQPGLPCTSFGFTSPPAQIPACQVRDHHASSQGIHATINLDGRDVTFETATWGLFNLSNLLASLQVLRIMGYATPAVLTHLAMPITVPGRMQRFGGQGQPTVIIDYAHTPDALQQVLQAVRVHTTGRIWCVFGCGGDRDRGKRAIMGQIADAYADFVVLTDDNPRHEASQDIIADIRAGIQGEVLCEPNRRQAIAVTIQRARPDDVVVIAGKGHEVVQIIGEQRHHFVDQQVVEEVLVHQG